MRKVIVNENGPQIPSLLQGFNQRWFADECTIVYLCNSNTDVEEALEEAVSLFGTNVKIKGGGHCYENFVFSPETKAIIDINGLNMVEYDPTKGYCLGSGGTNWEAFKALFRDYDKVLPSGSCYSVGLGGHICGGGYGLLSRLNGLTVDWLTGVEIVVKDDEDQPAYTKYVSKDSTGDDGDLFWAQCGGGGGNFGVITKYYFAELPTAPKTATISTFAFEWDDLSPDVLNELLLWFKEFSEDASNWNQFGLFKLNHKANGEMHLIIQSALGLDVHLNRESLERLERQTEELSQICPHTVATRPILGHSGSFIPNTSSNTIEYTMYEAVQTLNSSGPNQRGKYKSAYMRKEFSAQNIQTIFDQLQIIPDGLVESDMAQSLLQVDSYGGKINTVDSAATAIAQRDSIFKLQYQTYWTQEADDSKYLEWIRNFYAEMYAEQGGTPNPQLDPTNNVDGCYFNYPDSDLNDLVGKDGALNLYFLGNLDRLKKVKQRWDPNNYFNNAQSIPVD